MNTIVVALFAVMASVAAETNVPPTPIAILSQSQDMGTDGSFSSQFETANGISEKVKGSIKKIGKEEIQVIVGSFSWTDPNGVLRNLTYIADENGYQPQADFLPVAPTAVVAPVAPVAPAVPLPIQLALHYAAPDSKPVTTTEVPETAEITEDTGKTETTEETETTEKTEITEKIETIEIEKTETTEKIETTERTEKTETTEKIETTEKTEKTETTETTTLIAEA